jgi:hypothetical protein
MNTHLSKAPFSPSGARLALGLSGMLAVLLATAGSVARACPFCSAVSLTFAQEIAQAEVAVIARLVKPPPPGSLGPGADGPLPKGQFAVVDVLKGYDLVQTAGHIGDDATAVETILLEEKPVGSLFLLLGVEPPKLVWSSPITVSDKVVAYLKKLDSLPAKGPDRLAFFQQHLEDEEDTLARDAYDEFAVAPYEDVRGLENRMNPTQLLAWIEDPKVPANRRRLYATMLGVCGTVADAEQIERILVGKDLGADAAEIRTGLDALIACYVTLRGADGLDLVDTLFLDRADRDIPFTETYAAVMALRFLGEESRLVPRDRVLASLRLLLEEPKLADLVIADLARWQDWSAIDRLVEIFRDATADNIFVREPIVNYMKACPLPEASRAVETLTEIDPEAVRRAATLAGLAGAAMSSVPTESTATAQIQPGVLPPVLGDEDATDGEPGVDPSVTAAADPRQPQPQSIWPRGVRWMVWLVLVGLVALGSHAMLRNGPPAERQQL